MRGRPVVDGAFAEDMFVQTCSHHPAPRMPSEGPAARFDQGSPPRGSEPSPRPCAYRGDMFEVYTSTGRRLVGTPSVVVSLAGGGARTLAELEPGRDDVVTRSGAEAVLFKTSHRYVGVAYTLFAEPRAAPNSAAAPLAFVADVAVGGDGSEDRGAGEPIDHAGLPRGQAEPEGGPGRPPRTARAPRSPVPRPEAPAPPEAALTERRPSG